MDDIYKFYELRMACHIASVNYFASLLGLHFPEHDSDKIKEPTRTGYAFVFYDMYHKDFTLNKENQKLCDDVQRDHHAHDSHHISYYENVCDIPDVRLQEMLCDQAAANFEQQDIRKLKDAVPVEEWFKNNNSHLPWTPQQLEIIKTTFQTFRDKQDLKELNTIWQPLLEKADL